MSILEDIELSARTYNALRRTGTVNTLDDFMALDRKTVMNLKGAGVRTWKEVQEIQQTQQTLRQSPASGGVIADDNSQMQAFAALFHETHRHGMKIEQFAQEQTAHLQTLADTAGNATLDDFALAALPAVIRQCANDTRDPGETVEQMLARKTWAVAVAMLKGKY